MLFFKEIFVASGEIQEVKHSEFFEELLRLKQITHIKPVELKDSSIINPLMGALRESDPYSRCHRAELYH